MENHVDIGASSKHISTGIKGLDSILNGGLPEGHVFLVYGDSGSGKTTLGLQFLLEGIKLGETCVYVTVSESAGDLSEIAVSHGWKLDKLSVYEWRRPSEAIVAEDDYSFFPTFEVESNIAINSLKDLLKTIRPKRIVIDTLSDLRLVSREPLYYRRQMITLKKIWSEISATVLLLDQPSAPDEELRIESLVHGVLILAHDPTLYGPDLRYVRVKKMRGVDVSTGVHSLAIKKGGVHVYPRIQPSGLFSPLQTQRLKTGVRELDQMLNGGIHLGTTALIAGPSGVGKSTIASLFTLDSLIGGHKAAVYLLEESPATYIQRNKGLGKDLEPFVQQGQLLLHEILPSRISSGEFIHSIREAVLTEHVQCVVIDSLDGYLQTFQVEKSLALQLHELKAFLNENNVMTVFITSNHGPLGAQFRERADIFVSYLADSIIYLRYFEADGMIHKAISILKNRSSPHDDSIHEMMFVNGLGIAVGEPLEHLRGILTGVPFRTKRTEYKDRDFSRHQPT